MKKFLVTMLFAILLTMTAYADENVVIGVAPGDDTPYCDEVPLSKDLQKYVWEKCKASGYDATEYYAFIIGTIDAESSFRTICHSEYGDYGLMQTSSKWIFPEIKDDLGLTSIEQLDNPYIAIDCGVYEMNKCVARAGGINEVAYVKYNEGKWSKNKSSANSRRMVKLWQKWKETIFG